MIVAGGLLTAFSARKSTYLRSWVSAYLVLIAGVTQLGLAVGWQQLTRRSDLIGPLAFIIFNLGNLCVLAGTILKHRSYKSSIMVNGGGALLALSMALLVWAVQASKFSWNLIWFYALLLIVLISMPIGLFMSSHKFPQAS